MDSQDTVDYRHDCNLHTLAGAKTALPYLIGDHTPRHLLDVGCGTGTWLRAALDLGVERVRGIDGVRVAREGLHVDDSLITQCDFRDDWHVDGDYDLVLCLEVAEHLEEAHARRFIRNLTHCGDRIIFSAANPWQLGQHHVNCQWPRYWQGLFNQCGFVCHDTLRWKIWDINGIEPWYRQNVFCAIRDESASGSETRISSVMHPDCLLTTCRAWRSSNSSLAEVIVRRVDRTLRKCFGLRCYE